MDAWGCCAVARVSEGDGPVGVGPTDRERSELRTNGAALFYSLIESAKLTGVEPRAYLGEAALRALRNPGTVTHARDLK
jgi:hypothetical protein